MNNSPGQRFPDTGFLINQSLLVSTYCWQIRPARSPTKDDEYRKWYRRILKWTPFFLVCRRSWRKLIYLQKHVKILKWLNVTTTWYHTQSHSIVLIIYLIFLYTELKLRATLYNHLLVFVNSPNFSRLYTQNKQRIIFSYHLKCGFFYRFVL